MLTRELIETNLEFLKRVDLKGIEVPAFVNLTNALHHMHVQITSGPVAPVSPIRPDPPADAEPKAEA
jgi:hypothetical protein